MVAPAFRLLTPLLNGSRACVRDDPNPFQAATGTPSSASSRRFISSPPP